MSSNKKKKKRKNWILKYLPVHRRTNYDKVYCTPALCLYAFLKTSHSLTYEKKKILLIFFITMDEEKFCSVTDILQVNPCQVYLLRLEKVTGAEISPSLPYRVTSWLEKVNISRLHNIEFNVQASNYVNSLYFMK